MQRNTFVIRIARSSKTFGWDLTQRRRAVSKILPVSTHLWPKGIVHFLHFSLLFAYRWVTPVPASSEEEDVREHQLWLTYTRLVFDSNRILCCEVNGFCLLCQKRIECQWRPPRMIIHSCWYDMYICVCASSFLARELSLWPPAPPPWFLSFSSQRVLFVCMLHSLLACLQGHAPLALKA